MVRLIAIALLIALAFVLIRYRTNEKLQKGVVIVILATFVTYTAFLMISELIRLRNSSERQLTQSLLTKRRSCCYRTKR